jgi:hypothetical protein
MNLRKTITVTMVAASLGIGTLAFAPAAGAQTSATPTKSQICQRAHNRWEKLKAANERAVDEYHRLRARQQQLLANHHDVAAHRLDVALDAARRRHERIVARVVAIAEKVKDRCSEQPPALTQL